MKLSDAKIDPVKQEQGAWVDNVTEVFPEFDGFRLKVRGANNSDWRKLERRLIEAVPRKQRITGKLSIEDQDRIESECLFQCGLLDWDGLVDDDKPVSYSKPMAHDLLFEPEYQRIKTAVRWACNVVAEQQEADRDDVVKN